MLTPAILLLFFSNSLADQCFDWANFHTDRGFIRVNGLPMVLKGITWFGLETETLAPHGLWSYSMDSFLDIIAKFSLIVFSSLLFQTRIQRHSSALLSPDGPRE